MSILRFYFDGGMHISVRDCYGNSLICSYLSYYLKKKKNTSPLDNLK